MCGILVNISREKIGPDHPALEIIKHRGPDAFGAETFETPASLLSFGHRRLSIIDLSEKGRQPMSYAGGRFWITFNGEVYNYLEIRAELEKENYSFVSDSDTEVILASYMKWGTACLDRFNGMFAFAIYDRETQKLFIVRDRLGVKPVYYYNSATAFRVASEIKQFTGFSDFTPEANKEKLYHYLNTGDFSFDNSTMWKNIFELEPGHCIELDLSKWKPGNEIKPVRWYSPPFGPELDISYEDAVSEFRARLDQSVKFRLRADVPVGFLLSGGLDSSTLVGLGHLFPREKDAGLKTYSSCYDDKKIDERKYIKAVLEATGADSALHFPKPADVQENLEKVIWHNDIPVLHGSPVPHWLLYKHVRGENDNRKVIMEGQGADEILCGYGDFHWAFFFEMLKKGRLVNLLSEFIPFQRRHHEEWKIIIRKFIRLCAPDRIPFPANPLLNTEFLFDGGKVPLRPVRREEPDIPSLHKNRLTILRYILHNVDRNSMAHSRETRVPFLDYKLVEFCLRLPSSYKIHHGLTKRVMRDAVKDVLPPLVANRHDKQGYSSPVGRWAANELKDFFAENLRQSSDLPFVRKETILSDFTRFTKTGGAFDPVWWRIINAKKWIEIFKIKI